MQTPHPESLNPRVFYHLWVPKNPPYEYCIKTFELLKTGEAAEWGDKPLDPDVIGRFWVIGVEGQKDVNFFRPKSDYFTPQPTPEVLAALTEAGLKVGEDGTITKI